MAHAVRVPVHGVRGLFSERSGQPLCGPRSYCTATVRRRARLRRRRDTRFVARKKPHPRIPTFGLAREEAARRNIRGLRGTARWLLLHGAPDVAHVRAQLVGRAPQTDRRQIFPQLRGGDRRRRRLLLGVGVARRRRRRGRRRGRCGRIEDATDSSSSASSSAWSSARFRARWTTTLYSSMSSFEGSYFNTFSMRGWAFA